MQDSIMDGQASPVAHLQCFIINTWLALISVATISTSPKNPGYLFHSIPLQPSLKKYKWQEYESIMPRQEMN
jgi:hypothetical protein